MADTSPSSDAPEHGAPSEEELRAAYEAELERITSADLLLQTTASLINIGAHRMGLTGGEESNRDLEQVRDAIDGVRALLPILERRGATRQLPAIRDALSQLQLAYTREVQTGSQAEPAERTEAQGATAERPAGGSAQDGKERSDSDQPPAERPGDPRRPGPAESSGRLWIPGKG